MADRTSLARFLAGDPKRRPPGGPEVASIVLDIARACRTVADRVASAQLDGAADVKQGEGPGRLHIVSQHLLLGIGEWNDAVAAVMFPWPANTGSAPRDPDARRRYLLALDPLNGRPDADGGVAAGTLFSILREPTDGDEEPASSRCPASPQLAAGYVLYGPATELVVTVGSGVHRFTLDRDADEFVLTGPDLRIPPSMPWLGVDLADRPAWEPAVRRFVDERLVGGSYTVAWTGSPVADLHRVLTRGGVVLRAGAVPTRPRLLHDAGPVALLVEQAGGRAETGAERVLDLLPAEPDRRVPLAFGSAGEVARLADLHRRGHVDAYEPPLFASRGLYLIPG